MSADTLLLASAATAVHEPDCRVEVFDEVYHRPHTMVDRPMHYCPGCAHSLVHKLLMEVVEEMGIQQQTIGVAPVGCSVFAYEYMNIDMQEAAHGRACAVATGIRRLLPDHYVFTYQGDGDLAAIGIAETIHAINRGENLLIVFMNNGVYGMTSGQMAPTTPEGIKTTTSPYGRDVHQYGAPIRFSELVAPLPGAVFVTRQTVHTANAVRKTKKALQKAFALQKEKRGTCLVEIIGNCPSNWRMTPVESMQYIEDVMLKTFPAGDIKG